MRSSPLLCKIGSAAKRSRSGYYALLRQTWLYRLQAFAGAAPPEMFTLKRCASGSFAAMLQNGSVMVPGVISPTPSSSKSTRPPPRSRTKRSYRPRPSRHAAPCRNVSSRTHGTSCQPQRGHRGTSSPRTSNPAMPRGRLAQHEVDVSRGVGPLLLEAGVEVVASVRFARGANAWLRWPLAH